MCVTAAAAVVDGTRVEKHQQLKFDQVYLPVYLRTSVISTLHVLYHCRRRPLDCPTIVMMMHDPHYHHRKETFISHLVSICHEALSHQRGDFHQFSFAITGFDGLNTNLGKYHIQLPFTNFLKLSQLKQNSVLG